MINRLAGPRQLLQYQSGRVIAIGRLMLVVMFMLAVSVDRTQPIPQAQSTFALLVLYGVFALLVTAATWWNWWLDARLSAVTHGIDMAVFTAIVFSTNGSTSPFFLFFVLPLLSAAVRWNWRETTLTAATLIVLYFVAGFMLAGTQSFELERFVIRTGHLIILSLLLIWFGVHQGSVRLFLRMEDFEPMHEQPVNPLERALGVAMQVAEASGGALVIGPEGEETADGFSRTGGEGQHFTTERVLVLDPSFAPMLYDIDRNRVVGRDRSGHFRFAPASEVIDVAEAKRLGLGEGVIAEVRSGMQQGWLALSGIPNLSTDYFDVGQEVGRAVGAILDRRALLAALENSTAARTRLGLARDVHDSIVQFLAGAAFRVEAVKRAGLAGEQISDELDEIKRLLIEEQGELRGFVMALRQNRDLELEEAVAELRALAERLSQQWSVDCRITAGEQPASIPIRLQLDLQQMLREAVANAVRHGRARHVDVDLAVAEDRLNISVADDGAGFNRDRGHVEPWSLKERVQRAHGTLKLVSAPGSTNILISLPLAGVPA